MIRRGFTLLELMLALVISTLLVGGILVVAASLSRDRQRLGHDTSITPADGLASLLKLDLGSATSTPVTSAGGISLRSHHALDAATLVPTGRFCQITYRLHDGHLIREQQLLDDPLAKSAAPTRHLILANVSSFSIQSLSGGTRYRVHVQPSQSKPMTFDLQVR